MKWEALESPEPQGDIRAICAATNGKLHISQQGKLYREANGARRLIGDEVGIGPVTAIKDYQEQTWVIAGRRFCMLINDAIEPLRAPELADIHPLQWTAMATCCW